MPDWIFAGWEPAVRTVVVGVASYAALITVVRLSGKRTLSKLNAFDLVVTVALGSTVATILLSKEVALLEGLVALGLLVGLQFGMAYLSVRLPFVSQRVKSEPTLIVRNGEMLRGAMRRERVGYAEVEQAARINGRTSMDEIGAMILETDGSFSVVPAVPEGHRSSTTPTGQINDSALIGGSSEFPRQGADDVAPTKSSGRRRTALPTD
ncbi:MAG: YetF domain-containing protein [Chloroflexota bacterium]